MATRAKTVLTEAGPVEIVVPRDREIGLVGVLVPRVNENMMYPPHLSGRGIEHDVFSAVLIMIERDQGTGTRCAVAQKVRDHSRERLLPR